MLTVRTPIAPLFLAALGALLGAGCEIHEAAPPPSPLPPSAAPTASPPPPSASPTVSVSAAPSASASAAPSAPVTLVGDWVSPSCGERKYPRHITFDDKTGFSASDLVSPCPKGVTCIWSGIVTRKGTWSSDGKRVTLTLTGPADKRGAPFPASLDLAPGPAEGATCPYQRAEKAAF